MGLSAFVAGCNGGGDIPDATCSPGAVPGVNVVHWKTDLEGTARVEYGLDEAKLDATTPGVPASKHEATVLGLKVAERYAMRVVVEAEGEEHTSDVFECETEPPPDKAPPFSVIEWNPDLACEDGGYVLFNWMDNVQSGVGIVDRDGRYVWAVAAADNQQFARARLARDGHSILWNTNQTDRKADIATIERMSLDGTETTTTRIVNGHHDFVELPDGTFAYIAYEMIEPSELEAAGFDIEALGFPVDNAAGWGEIEWAYDRIYEINEGAVEGDEPTLVFDHLQDWPEGVYHNHTNFPEKCTHFLPENCELGHANSLTYVPSEDRYTIGFRWLDAILNLDRTGDVKWVLGGPQSTLVGPEEDLPVHPHFSDAWAGGMLVYDNRDNDPPTRLVQYAIDGAEGTFENVWSYQSPAKKPDKILGDVRRIPIEGCDNLLVSWSSDGVLEERTRDGQVAWSIQFAVGNITGRVQYLSSVYDFTDQANAE